MNTQGLAAESPKRLRRIGFRIAAVALGFVFFALVELSLRILGIGDPHQAKRDPLVGFSAVHRLFELDAQQEVYQTARSRQLDFGFQQFGVRKAANNYRIFCLGGSTVRGRPFDIDTAFPKWLELILRNRDGVDSCEVVNCGGISYASYRLRVLLDEVIAYQPDLIVLATGPTEFLEDRTYAALKARSPTRSWVEDRAMSLRTVTALRRLWNGQSEKLADNETGALVNAEVEPRLDRPGGYASYHRDDAWHAAVIQQFKASLNAMVATCGKAGIPIIIVKLGSNLRDAPPFKSEHANKLDGDEHLRWQQAVETARQLELSDPEQALAAYQVAAEISPGYAVVTFRIARCLDRLGQTDEALQFYAQARDEDVCPLRMLGSMESYLTALETSGATVIDAADILSKSSDVGIPGYDIYLDHVHPTVMGHQIIANAVAEAVRSNLGLPAKPSWNAAQRRRLFADHLKLLGSSYVAQANHRIRWLEGWARRQRVDDAAWPSDPRTRLGRGMRHLQLGLSSDAREVFLDVLSQDDSTAGRMLDFAHALFLSGQSDAAGQIIDALSDHEAAPDRLAEVTAAQVVVAVELGDRQRAAEWHGKLSKTAQGESIQSHRWLAVVPDAIHRAAALIDEGQ